jgi:hypothetical protein
MLLYYLIVNICFNNIERKDEYMEAAVKRELVLLLSWFLFGVLKAATGGGAVDCSTGDLSDRFRT